MLLSILLGNEPALVLCRSARSNRTALSIVSSYQKVTRSISSPNIASELADRVRECDNPPSQALVRKNCFHLRTLAPAKAEAACSSCPPSCTAHELQESGYPALPRPEQPLGLPALPPPRVQGFEQHLLACAAALLRILLTQPMEKEAWKFRSKRLLTSGSLCDPPRQDAKKQRGERERVRLSYQ